MSPVTMKSQQVKLDAVRQLCRLALACGILLCHPAITIADESSSKPAEVSHLQIVPGGWVSRSALGEHEVTYHIYTPTNYKPSATSAPIVVAFSPNGNGKSIAQKLQPAAESEGWIVVGCDKLRNGMKDEALEVAMEDEVLADVFTHVPHDPDRIYLAGFSGGAMRAYGITARRSEPFAGILAYGGWLGGEEFQDKPYRKGMSVAMITGVRDRGASRWVPIDTRTLRKRDCAVKHYAFVGGHKVAPAEVTSLAVDWLDEQWSKKSTTAKQDKIPLRVLYVGGVGKTAEGRAEDFQSFLAKHFVSVSVTSSSELTLKMSNRADVLLLDTVVRSLPDGYSKSMLMTGSSAAMTAERYGSKIDWLCQCLDNEAYSVNTSHPIFAGPLSVTPTLVDKRCPHSKMKIQAWKVEEPQETPGLVSSRKHFQYAEDSEIISGGVNMKGVSGVPLVREGHRLLWGFVAAPTEMTEEGRSAFVNALVWIHGFDGEAQSVFAGMHDSSTIASVLNSPYVDETNLIRWFPQQLIQQCGGEKEKIRKHFEGRLSYVYVPWGSGQLQVDEDAYQLKTPNNDAASLAKWIQLLDGEQGDVAYQLLLRYSGQRLRKKPKQWQDWLDENKDVLQFSQRRGYRFYASKKDAAKGNAASALRGALSGADELELTDISPVLFQRGLKALHTIDGVAHQYCGWKVTLAIRARVKEGWHFYSATKDNGSNIPTKIEIDLPEGMEFVGDWAYPDSDGYELNDGATFTRVIRMGKKPSDRAEIKGTIHFQACKEAQCLRPQTLQFSLPITVMAK